MSRTFLGGLFLLLVSLSSAHAARIIPVGGAFGDLGAYRYPQVVIGGKTLNFAPGTLIRDQNNRRLLPDHLPASARIYYRLDMNGDLRDLWLISAEEEADIKARTPRAP